MADEPNNPEQKVSGREWNRTLAQALKYSHIGFVIPAGAVGGWLLGAWLDNHFGTTYWTITCILLGIVGGFYDLIKTVMRMSKNDGR
jgi:F0F1-type ATP synthase assembly protein I